MVPSSFAFLDTRTFLRYPWQNYAKPLSPFPLSFAFPEHIPRQHVAPYHKEIKQIFHHWRGAEMYISTLWLRSLAEVNKWLKSLEDPATSVRLLSDFSALKICATLQGQASQLGSIAWPGCTISIEFYLSLLLSPFTPLSSELSSCTPPATPLASVWMHHWYTLWSQGGRNTQNISFPHFTAWIIKGNNPFWRNIPSLLTPSTATAVILALHFLQGIGLLSPWVSIPRLNKQTISLAQTKADIWWLLRTTDELR